MEKKTKYNNNKVRLVAGRIVKESDLKKQGIEDIGGIKFDSKIESLYYLYLKELQSAGEVLEIQRQPRYLLQDKFEKYGEKIKSIHYVADFVVFYKDHIEVIDIKGAPPTEAFEIKRKMFNFKYPNLKLKVLKYVKKAGGWVDYYEYEKSSKESKKNKSKL